MKQQTTDVISLTKCKEILGNEANDLTDEEIILIREWLIIMADIAIESLEKQSIDKVKTIN